MTRARIKLVVLLAMGLTLGALVMLHTRGLNGPRYWRWRWQQIEAHRLYPAMLLAGAPFFLGQWLYARRRRTAAALVLVMLSTLGLELAAIGMQMDPFNLDRVAWVIENPWATSYYVDAAQLCAEGGSFRDWMSSYPERMPDFHQHSRFKPPGALLYHVAFIRLFGANRLAALLGGLLVGVLATGSVAATYLLLRRLGGDAEAAFYGASFFGLCPSLVVFFPQFDQIHPAVGCLIVVLWAAALAGDRARFSLGFGLLLSLACFFSYIYLVLGLFLGGLSVLHVRDQGRRGLAAVVRHSAIALSVVAVLYALFWSLTGFDPLATFAAAARLEAVDMGRLTRPYPVHVVFDLLDFALGCGWIGLLLVLYFFVAPSDPSRVSRRHVQLGWLALVQVVVFAVLSLLPGEAARLWMALYPLLMIPIGLELAGWAYRPRLAVYALLWFLTTALAQNMGFILRVTK